MNSRQRLRYCKVCTNRKTDASTGLVCGLTGEVADFEDECDDFDFDEVRSIYYKKREARIQAHETTTPFGLTNLDKEKYLMLSIGLTITVISLIVLIKNWQKDYSWVLIVPIILGISVFGIGVIKSINSDKD